MSVLLGFSRVVFKNHITIATTFFDAMADGGWA